MLAPHFQVQHAFKKQLTKYFIAFQKKGPRWFKSFKRFFFLGYKIGHSFSGTHSQSSKKKIIMATIQHDFFLQFAHLLQMTFRINLQGFC